MEANLTSQFYNDKVQSDNGFDDFGDFVGGISINSENSQSDGIAILVDMAKTGKIDPWNIEIVDITDKYLQQLVEIKMNNLKMTGRTLLFAAILLRLKSNILEGIDPMQFEPQEVFEPDFDDNWGDEDINSVPISQNNVISLEDVLQRRTSVRLNRSRTVTLKDLIRQLEFYEELDKKQALKNTLDRAKRRVQSYARFSADDIINLAHDEYIEHSVKKLQENLKKIFETEEKVELNTLTLLGLDKISAYIALLFLASNTDYDLVQDEFYSDLYVTKQFIKTEVDGL